MSCFLNSKYKSLVPYTPGEQPKNMEYVKLNTNESPFPPSFIAQDMAKKAAEKLQLYSDPECRDLVKTAADYFGVETDEIIFTNGSDEVLNFAFMAFCENGAVFPDITYGFYSVFAELNDVDYSEIPLNDDFSVDINKYIGVNKTVFLANPNAPTGIALSVEEIEKIVKSNPENVVVIDEAYVDFGADSVIPLIKKYDNLLVTQTFSKSRSLAGGRLGFGIGSKNLIRDLNAIRYSTNPYNVNSVTAAAGIGSLLDDVYIKSNCKKIIDNREYLISELEKLDFTMTTSCANFIFAKHKSISGKDIYIKLKEKGVLVRYFDKERLRDYTRITIGSKEQLEILICKIKENIEELL